MAGQLARERFAAQLLSTPVSTDAADVVSHLLAVQGQDLRGARLAVRARSTGLRSSDVDARFNDGTLIVTWVNRGTLHLIRADDYALLHTLTTPQLATGNARRLQQEGVSPEQAARAAKMIRLWIARDGPLARDELRNRLRSRDIPTEGQALVHLLMFTTLKGWIVRGPISGKQHQFVLTDQWLDRTKPISRDKALGELARRYLTGHAPATDRDLAMWAGISLGDARKALQYINTGIEERADGQVQLKFQQLKVGPPPTRWLGPYDPVLHGWTSREWLLGANVRQVTIEGLFRPFVLERGVPLGTWSLARRAEPISPFAGGHLPLSRALVRDRQDLETFLQD